MKPTTPKRAVRRSDGDIARHVPFRQCVGCRTRAEKFRLLRFVRSQQGSWLVDPPAREPGRGAYLCSPECMERLKKNKRYKGLLTAEVLRGQWPTQSDVVPGL
jgi:uncharacterized protein